MDQKRAAILVAGMHRSGRVFFDVKEWFDWIKKQESMLQGMPTLILCQDIRTKEMYELVLFSHISLSVAKDLSLEDMYEQTAFREMHARNVHMCSRYIAFLEKNGMQHTF